MENARLEVERAEHSYLRSHGWRYTSSTPGCLWMWVKRCDVPDSHKRDAPAEPCLIMVSTSTAIAMQRHSCAIRGNKW